MSFSLLIFGSSLWATGFIVGTVYGKYKERQEIETKHKNQEKRRDLLLLKERVKERGKIENN
ncbi:hypothetical protein AYK24_08315 [Thermoplasmatales archaeon SG8-52-4]|nr:MAG: hypothetical protein AYK24_08315 [Thermoplasmatales archaeon SG8-52-4]